MENIGDPQGSSDREADDDHTSMRASTDAQVAVSTEGRQRRWRRLTQSGDNSGYLVIVWDLTAPPGSPPNATLLLHTDAVTSTAFSPNGQQLASGSNDGIIGIWAVPSFRQVRPCCT